MYKITSLSILVACLIAGNASAASITWSGAGGISMLNNPSNIEAPNAISSLLAPQNTLLQTSASNKASAAQAASSSTTSGEASLITQEVESSIASDISQSITGANGSADTGSFNLGNGQTISYNRANGTTSVSILNPGQSPLNLSFPNIQ